MFSSKATKRIGLYKEVLSVRQDENKRQGAMAVLGGWIGLTFAGSEYWCQFNPFGFSVVLLKGFLSAIKRFYGLIAILLTLIHSHRVLTVA